MAEAVLFVLLKMNLAAGAAALLALALRPWARRWLGARAAYRLWLVVPVAALAVLVPAREAPPAPYRAQEISMVVDDGPLMATPSIPPEFGIAGVDVQAPVVVATPPQSRTGWLLALWLAGAAALLARAVVATRRIAADPATGPALVGVLRPRLVLPADFEARFDARERALILAHEDAHRAGGHARLNALVELARCLCWFNPLAHVAARAVRADQELACDAAVIRDFPAERGAYARALLKAQIAPNAPLLGCAWPSGSAALVKERIGMLERRAPGRGRILAGIAALGVLSAAAGAAAWAAQPPRAAPPQAVWTPSAEAPMSAADPTRYLLTELEAQRHDLFIDLARNATACALNPSAGMCTPGSGIDVVFFGTTNTEMFWWPDRGAPVWGETIGRDWKAVNFGSQGTRPESLLWRMQNGELDGYQAKLIVLSAFCCARGVVPAAQRAELIANYEPIIAEIRARQPQAKILILADFPRGFEQFVEEWRAASAQNAAVHAPLVDNETVFYADIGERFYLPDGRHDNSAWARMGVAGVGVGMQPHGFEVWAEEMEPWIERFVE